MDYISETAPGSFGDREVLLHFFKAGSGRDCPAVLLLHGVHGWASPAEGNKYGFLARELAANGVSACIAESSRLRRDRETFGDDRVSWAKAAFRGKTFMGLRCLLRTVLPPGFSVSVPVLWGFLGGLFRPHRGQEDGGLYRRDRALGRVAEPSSPAAERIRRLPEASLFLFWTASATSPRFSGPHRTPPPPLHSFSTEALTKRSAKSHHGEFSTGCPSRNRERSSASYWERTIHSGKKKGPPPGNPLRKCFLFPGKRWIDI